MNYWNELVSAISSSSFPPLLVFEEWRKSDYIQRTIHPHFLGLGVGTVDWNTSISALILLLFLIIMILTVLQIIMGFLSTMVMNGLLVLVLPTTTSPSQGAQGWVPQWVQRMVWTQERERKQPTQELNALVRQLSLLHAKRKIKKRQGRRTRTTPTTASSSSERDEEQKDESTEFFPDIPWWKNEWRSSFLWRDIFPNGMEPDDETDEEEEGDEEDQSDDDDVYLHFYGNSTQHDDERDSLMDESESSVHARTTSRLSLTRMTGNPPVTHFCFLVHGHRGFSKDLSYLQHKMEQVASKTRRRRRKELRRQAGDTTVDVNGITSTTTTTPRATSTTSPIPEQTSSTLSGTATTVNEDKDKFVPSYDLVVHSVTCNERKTDDGVAAGGTRLVEEILHVLRLEMMLRGPSNGKLQIITISMLGNSLGGIYSRYAMSELVELCERTGDGGYILDGKFLLYFNVFCTTATPHLGIAGHTFIPIPRTAEIGVAHALGNTGKDLFRLNDLMKRMATEGKFVAPLRAFRKRIAYANAYGTDFPVPLQTAAFLSKSSTYPHHFVEDSQDEDRLVVDDNGLVIATLHTPPQHQYDSSSDRSPCVTEEECFVDDEENDELVEMSRSLDSLGWKKVFIDVRKEIPKITLPKALVRRTNSTNVTNTTETSSGESDGDDNSKELIHQLKERGVVSSKDVAAALTKPLFFDEKFHWPMGHNMIVAFSRGPISAYINRGGRPVVDNLANELVHTIFSWNNDKSTEINLLAQETKSAANQN